MTAESIPLRFAGAGRMARLRELTGRDEYSVVDASTAKAIALIAALLDEGTANDTDPIRATDLVAADRDRLLATVYERAFGDRIESTLTCARCGQPFDVDFSLRQLMESINERAATVAPALLQNGRVETADGLRFRLPTGHDELAVAGLPLSEAELSLLQRCAEGDWPNDQKTFDSLLEQVAPLLDLELVARCAECGHVHKIEFDIQTYVLGAIAAERRRLLAEVHRIAKAYGWPLDSILALTRSDRRFLVDLIENESVRNRRPRS